MPSFRRGGAVLASIVLLGCAAAPARAGDPDALWKIIDGQCVAHQRQSGDPSPCTQLDARPEAGFAVLKDHVGVAQFLVIPTTRLTGIESPELLADGAPNYWAEAWPVAASVEERLHQTLARDQVALAINSAFGRTQNQLHIHVDCIRPEIRDALRQHLDVIGEQWAPLGVTLAGHPYWARRILGSTLGDNNPFKLLAEGLPDARQHMERQTLVLTGVSFADGGDGFVLLTDHADLASLDRASGEELQDHDCAIASR
ncbi:MAG TPA: CDP-diacylglycerol diphosphatase [Patescibacteria group bacterium]|nr:CDP-diacylglycerol diphosphatase [Patescibacteria group bacterium]